MHAHHKCSPGANSQPEKCERGPACRFFHVAHAYHAELERYQSPVLRPLMPLLLHASARADCAVANVALPPFVICERGATLLDWARHKRSSGEVRRVLLPTGER